VHRVVNPREFNARAVSLHVYSKPFDTCVVYSPEQGTCGEIQLHFNTDTANREVTTIIDSFRCRPTLANILPEAASGL